MSDDDKPKPKRDPNKPFPKPAQRQGKLLKLLVSGAFVVGVTLVGLYSAQIGKPPWEWGQEDAEGFVDYSKDQVAEAKDQFKKIDWGKLGEKTKELWNKAGDLEQRLEKKMASLAEKRKAKSGSSEGKTEDGKSGEPAAAVEAPPSDLELGCKAMREGTRHYRKGVNDQAELKKARAKFEQAAKHFEAAQSGAADPADRQEAAALLEENQRYLYDCIKLEKVGG